MGEPNHLMISRLRKEMDRMGLNARQLSDLASVGRSFVYDILSGKSANPTTQKISAVAEILGVSVPYLISGTSNDNHIAQNSGDDFVAVPRMTTSRDKNGNYHIDKQPDGTLYYFHKSWTKTALGTSPAALRVTFIDDTAMEPFLRRGDMVLVDTSKTQPSPPGIFILFDGAGLTPRRIEYLMGNNVSAVHVAADNKQYASYERHLGELDIAGRVVWYSRTI